MQSTEESSLLQSVLAVSPLATDVERAWAFLVFCGVVESKAHADFLKVATEKSGDLAAIADGLLDFATRRSELVDPGHELATRLWQYFQVGQSLEPEQPLGAEMDEGTQPGITGLVPVES